ncbi:HIT-like domain-containing protein [Amylostereum chailletii]|nr:HIT-like domain-containing protein [Amylostereum chailletii]
MTSHSSIISAIPAAFEKAKTAGDLLFFPSEVYKYDDCGIEFEVTLCPALLHKPTLPAPRFSTEPDGKKSDPFAPPYNEGLHVGDLTDPEEGNEYVVLLNKFSVVPHHFLLVTKEYQSQNAPLLPADLVQAYSILLAAKKAGKHYFAFYNCGENSGASQPHKHLQFIPTEEDDGPPIELLAQAAELQRDDTPFSLSTLPFANHIRRLAIPSRATATQIELVLAGAFIQLLDLCISTVRHAPDYPVGPPSYNVIITLKHIYVIPRIRETHVLRETGESMSVNSLGFAGLLLVKSMDEFEAVKKEGPTTILKGVACESVHDLQVQGTSELDGDGQ